MIPIGFLRTGPDNAEGVGNIELEAYYNCFNDPSTGQAFGLGLAVGLPTATPDVGERAVVYEPFFVTYKQFDSFGVNFSAGLEIEDPISGDDETEVGGDLGLAVFRRSGHFVYLIELGVEIEPTETLLRLAPGLYWQPCPNLEFGVALPIGLTDETPDVGVLALLTVEFGGDDDK